MSKINCILLIDDNPADNDYHTLQIQKANICNHVKIATNGDKALEYLFKSNDPLTADKYPRPDLIFLDINMPGMNGFEFLEEYRKLDDNMKSKVVIVMLTTSLNPADRKTAETIGEINEFKTKPLNLLMLQEILAKYFR
jgi:CheY-like chemotaxis protein